MVEIELEPNLLTNPRAEINPNIEPGKPIDRKLLTSIPSPGTLKLELLPASNSPKSLTAIIPEGTFATLTFDVAEYAESGDQIELINKPEAMDSFERFFKTTGQNATVTISSVVSVEPSFKRITTWGDIKSLFDD